VFTEEVRLVEAGDAYVDRGSNPDSWIVGNNFIQLSLAITSDRLLTIQQISSAQSGHAWLSTALADIGVNIAGVPRTLGTRDFKFDGETGSPRESGVELALRFRNDEQHVRVTRHFATYPGNPVIESWTTYESLDGRAIQIRDLKAFDVALRSGSVRWSTGLQVPPDQGGSFTMMSTDLASPLDIGASGRATESAVPWFTLDDGSGEAFFGGLLWPGAWTGHLQRDGDGVRAAFGLTSFSTTVSGMPLDTPHAYIGAVNGSTTSVGGAMGAFVDNAVRHGRAYSPLVTYNTWFTYGTAIDESSMLHEMDAAADLGVELFVVDAGWYKAGNDPGDFTTGIGVWEADTDRFPSGLGALSDHAHALGMKFGIWVEPERVDLRTVGRAGLARERWLAMQGGRYDPSKTNAQADSAQICLASAEARDWVLAKLTALIDTAHPDYLKWDNNFWVNCSRAGHGHDREDGNFAHVSALEQILATLRQRYPDLLIENCSGGGNRLEPSMLAFSDISWMDDRSLPASHVRHNLEGLSTLMPPSTLLSFVFGNEWAGGETAGDLPLALRSRMPGILGATWRSDELDDESRQGIRREIATYKALRDGYPDRAGRLLSPQVDESSSGWDVLQQTSASTGRSLIFAFENAGADDTTTVHPTGLQADTLYEVVSVDAGSLGRATGDELMASGIRVSRSGSRAHILEVRPSASFDGER